MYATGQSSPRDPVVAELVDMGQLPWEESLAGAAAGMLLDTERGVTLEAARWAAVRAGYPYPVESLIRGSVAMGEVPADLAAAAQKAVGPDDQVGVVRARSGDRDEWLVLVGRPRTRLAAFPRELKAGDELPISSSTPTTWALVSPSGRVVRGISPDHPRLEEVGEWLLVVRLADAQGEPGALVADLPLFVGIPTPPAPIFEVPGQPASSPGAATDELTALLADVRDAFELPALEPDPTLATLAEQPLFLALSGAWSADAGVARMRSAGFLGGPAAELACEAITPTMCVEGWMDQADSRAILLDQRYRLLGIAVQARTDGIVAIANLTSD